MRILVTIETTPPQSGTEPITAEAIGDGTILRLIAEYGPKLLALLVQLGLLKVPGAADVSDKA